MFDDAMRESIRRTANLLAAESKQLEDQEHANGVPTFIRGHLRAAHEKLAEALAQLATLRNLPKTCGHCGSADAFHVLEPCTVVPEAVRKDEALRAIMNGRDSIANGAPIEKVCPGYGTFDDWAADVAQSALTGSPAPAPVVLGYLSMTSTAALLCVDCHDGDLETGDWLEITRFATVETVGLERAGCPSGCGHCGATIGGE